VAKRLVLIAVLLLIVPATALAATVHVRVEGKTRTIFAPRELTVTASTPLAALEQASIAGEFYYHVTSASFGNYVDQIGRYPAAQSSGWVFKVDETSPPVGADKVQLKDGDTVLWYYADFGPTGGPPTLRLTKAPKGCYLVRAYDDNGRTTTVDGVVLHVGSKRTMKATVGEAACPGKHRGLLVRATATGAVRSNALT
jgi:hypothetical protein